jgi:hypothetical protein
MHQLRHRVVVDDRHLYRQMVRQYLELMKMVNDMENLLDHLVVLNQVRHLDELVRQIADVLQNLDEQILDVNLAYLNVHLVDVHLVDVVLVLNVVHLDELVLQVDVAFHRQMKMDYYLHVVDVAVKLVKLMM